MTTYYCSYCGRPIITMVMAIADTAHVQHLKIQYVCDRCQRPTEIERDQHDIVLVPAESLGLSLNQETKENWMQPGTKPEPVLHCDKCGGQMRLINDLWTCPACSAVEADSGNNAGQNQNDKENQEQRDRQEPVQ